VLTAVINFRRLPQAQNLVGALLNALTIFGRFVEKALLKSPLLLRSLSSFALEVENGFESLLTQVADLAILLVLREHLVKFVHFFDSLFSILVVAHEYSFVETRSKGTLISELVQMATPLAKGRGIVFFSVVVPGTAVEVGVVERANVFGDFVQGQLHNVFIVLQVLVQDIYFLVDVVDCCLHFSRTSFLTLLLFLRSSVQLLNLFPPALLAPLSLLAQILDVYSQVWAMRIIEAAYFLWLQRYELKLRRLALVEPKLVVVDEGTGFSLLFAFLSSHQVLHLGFIGSSGMFKLRSGL